MRHLLITTALALPLPAAAQDAALLLGQERYEQLDRVRAGDDVLASEDRFERLGFTVLSRANGRAEAVQDLAAAFQDQAGDAERLVVALSGHFVTDGARSWLLTAEAATPDLFTVPDVGLSVDSLLHVLSRRQGSAVLVIGAADPDAIDLGQSALSAGLAPFDVPQGVTVIRATPTVAAGVLNDVLTAPEAVIGTRLAANSDLQIDGFLPPDWVLMPGEIIVDEPAAPVGPSPDELTAEAVSWDEATAADTAESYRRYIAQFPQGRFVAEAETRIAAILAEPNRAGAFGRRST